MLWIRNGEEIPDDVCQFCGDAQTEEKIIWGAINLLPDGSHTRDLYCMPCSREHDYKHSPVSP